MNKEIINQLKSIKTVDELKEVAAKKGYVLSDEEAKGYFDMYHTSGKISENELDNVAGGLCRNGRCYSYDGDHHLIVTLANKCEKYEHATDDDHWGAYGTCCHCAHQYTTYEASYCNARTYYNDPLNPNHIDD